jgi:hypothetical protein
MNGLLEEILIDGRRLRIVPRSVRQRMLNRARVHVEARRRLPAAAAPGPVDSTRVIETGRGRSR